MFVRPEDISAVYLRIGFVDFRKGISGLSELMGHGVADGNKKILYVFANRSKNRLRILYWDDSGYALWHKALEEQKFKWPRRPTEDIELTIEKLRWLLSGVDIDKIKEHKKISAKSYY